MLTFSEMLVLLKSGEDLRHSSWPRGAYLRAFVVSGKPEARKITSRSGGTTVATYSPTQAELFGQDWSKA